MEMKKMFQKPSGFILYLKKSFSAPLMQFFRRFLYRLSFFALCLIGLNSVFSFQAFFQEVLANAAGHVYGIWGSGWAAAENLLIHLPTGRFITIESSCSGIGMCVVLCAVIFALPGGWCFRSLASLFGVALIQCWNVFRIAHLFHLSVKQPELFEFYHLNAWQAGNLVLMILVIAGLLAFTNRKSGYSPPLKRTFRPRAVAAAFMFVLLPIIITAATAYAWPPPDDGGDGGGGGVVPCIMWWQLIPLVMYIGIYFNSAFTKDE